MLEKYQNEVFGFSRISPEVLEISQFFKWHIIKHQNAQLCPNLTDLVSLIIFEILMITLEFGTPCT